MLSNLIALAVPFTTYFLAEELQGSGVLAVVACGIVYSRYNGNANDSAIRLVGIPFWSVLTYLMNTVLFIMLGLSLPDIVRRLSHQELVRGLVVFITAGATLLSLVVQGLALPHVVRWANARPTAVQRREAEELDEETRVLAGIMRDIVEELPSMAQRIGVEDGELVNAIRESYGRREQRMLQAASEEEFSFFRRGRDRPAAGVHRLRPRQGARGAQRRALGRGDRLPGDQTPRHRGRTAGGTDRDGVRPPELPARRFRPLVPAGPPQRWPRPSTR